MPWQEKFCFRLQVEEAIFFAALPCVVWSKTYIAVCFISEDVRYAVCFNEGIGVFVEKDLITYVQS